MMWKKNATKFPGFGQIQRANCQDELKKKTHKTKKRNNNNKRSVGVIHAEMQVRKITNC